MVSFELAEPRAAALIEALRAVGYSPETAIADLVDNSIAAGARNVRLSFEWDGSHSFISLLDDGHGMSAEELSAAMRPGSRNPLEERDANDLGRFGLGLKTASFSQCRQLVVASKRLGVTSVRTWDLDYVGETGEWRLLTAPPDGSEKQLAPLESLTNGTLVLWRKLDRLVGTTTTDDRRAHERFLQLISRIKQHLEMVFHRFLARDDGRVRMWINGTEARHRLEGWDPFLEGNPSTTAVSAEERMLTASSIVAVKGFVLPHKDRLSDEAYREAGGPRGWHGQQGFYVYRNKRLLVSGGWLGLEGLTSEEHYKLARIRIDLPSAIDSEWAIDVKKSRARPPGGLRARLAELASAVRAKARNVYVHRGRSSLGPAGEPLRRGWLTVQLQGRVAYRIDRSNPVIKSILADPPPSRSTVEAALKLLEATVPVQQIWLDAIEHPAGQSKAFEGDPPESLREVVQAMFQALRRDGVSSDLARQRLSSMPPFDQHPDIVAALTDETE